MVELVNTEGVGNWESPDLATELRIQYERAIKL